MKRCFIIGGGPSVKDTNLDLIKNEFVIGVNEAYRFGNFIDIWFFCDSDIFKNHRKDIDKWPNRIVSCAKKAKNHKKIEYYFRCRQHAICFEERHLAFPSPGANSGATAVNLAIREGFNSVVLIGFDMKTVDGKYNYHDYYKKPPNENAYEKFMGHFERIAAETDIEIINANPDSAMDFFPKIRLEDL